MLSISGSQSLQASAGASVVIYTVSGLVTSTAAPPVAQAYEILAQGNVPTSTGPLFTPGVGMSALLSSLTFFNTSASTQTVTIYADGTSNANGLITLSIPANGTGSHEDGHGWGIYSGGVPITASTVSGTAGGDLAGAYPNPTLAPTANVESIISNNPVVTSALQSISSPSQTIGVGISGASVTLDVVSGQFDPLGSAAAASTAAIATSNIYALGQAQAASVNAVSLIPHTPISIVNGGTASSVSPIAGQSLYATSSVATQWQTPIGKQVAYSAVAANFSASCQVLNTFYPAALTSGVAPVVTLPSDGYTYKVELVGSTWTSSTAGLGYIGIGSTSASIIAVKYESLNNVASPFPTVIIPQIIGSGQTLNVYVAAASGGWTIAVAAGATSAPTICSLSAYRVA